MGRYVFRLPDIGEGIAEAEILVWHVKVGDTISEDQSLLDVMTDKATIDMTSPVDGVVTALHGEPGSMMPVGAVLVEFEVAGDDNAVTEDMPPRPAPRPTVSPDASDPAEQPAPPAGRPPMPLPDASPRPVQPAFTFRPSGATPLASPATRRRAFELGIPLQFVPGTGPAGRIAAEDLAAYVASGGANPQPGAASQPRTGEHETRIIGLRRKIADRTQDSKRRIPHIAYVEECDLTELEALRADLNAHRSGDQPKLTLLPFFMRALVRALPDFPQINARYDDDAGVLHSFDGVHIGIATQTPDGLMVPIIRHAETLDIWDCARELARVAQAARDGKATRDELAGSTISITSLGPLGGVVTTPVINHPEVAILAPNKLIERPIVQGSFVTMRKMMNLSSSFDHRIVDGWDAAQFIQRIKRMLEHPALIFLD